MTNNIKPFIKKNRIFYFLVLKVRYFQYNIFDRFIFNFKLFFRKNLQPKKTNNDIRNFENLHKNDKCFIVATGPSLTINDLELIKDEITFGMNSLCKAFPKLGWETTYFGVQDYEVYGKLEKDILNLKTSTVFLADILKKRFDMKNTFIQYPLNLLNHNLHYSKPYNTKFSNNAYEVVYDGYTITYSLIQLAIYMGFKDIYLIGADTNYSKDISKRNFVNIGKVDKTYDTAGDRIRYAYGVANNYIKTRDVNIYNATRGGALEIFPRVNLDKLNFLKTNGSANKNK